MPSRILILLSTYNGEQYIADQLDSILAQRFSGELNVLIRDDGSTDATVAKIDDFRDPRITLIAGNNLGAKGSYLQLTAMAEDDSADYFAFADQDDIWLPDKLQRAVSCLRQQGALLYCSALQLVDESLRPLEVYRFRGAVEFEASLLRNAASGCTCVFGRELLRWLRRPVDSGQILMHDWWAYQLACAYGEVFYDDESHILYRQHGGNAVGLEVGAAALRRRFKGFLRRGRTPSRFTQARELLRCHGDSLTAEKTAYLEKFVHAESHGLQRLRLIFGTPDGRLSFLRNSASVTGFLLGR